MSTQSDNQLGGIFAGLGFFVGAAYGATLHPAGGLIGMFVGLFLGKFIEHLVFRAILVALVVIMIIARQAFFDAIFAYHAPVESDSQPQSIVSFEQQPLHDLRLGSQIFRVGV